jgi:hypothetical protein
VKAISNKRTCCARQPRTVDSKDRASSVIDKSESIEEHKGGSLSFACFTACD